MRGCGCGSVGATQTVSATWALREHGTKTGRWRMTALNSLDCVEPEPAEVADASLAMADYDAEAGDFSAALEWLGVAAQFRVLTPEYRHKQIAWEISLGRCDDAASTAAPVCTRGVRDDAPRGRSQGRAVLPTEPIRIPADRARVRLPPRGRLDLRGPAAHDR